MPLIGIIRYMAKALPSAPVTPGSLALRPGRLAAAATGELSRPRAPRVNNAPSPWRGMGVHPGGGLGYGPQGRARHCPRALAAALMVAAAAAAAPAAMPPALAGAHDAGESALPVLEIGALVTLGDEPFNDVMRLEAIRLAVDDHNRNGTKAFAIALSVHEFDRSAPVESYRAARAGGEGPLLFVGPTTSEPVAAIAGPATADGAVVVSPASSAMSLAVAGDAVFRLSPDGYLQASAIAGMMDDAGAGAAFVVAQDDTYGRDLASSLAGILPLRGIPVTCWSICTRPA